MASFRTDSKLTAALFLAKGFRLLATERRGRRRRVAFSFEVPEQRMAEAEQARGDTTGPAKTVIEAHPEIVDKLPRIEGLLAQHRGTGGHDGRRDSRYRRTG